MTDLHPELLPEIPALQGATTKGLPWPPPTDPVSQGAAAIRALAEAVDPFIPGAPSATPPASPKDGQIWTYLADAAGGVLWTFRYRAASTSAFKWEFVGGAPFTVLGAATPFSAPLATWWNPVTGLQTPPLRPGDYLGRVTWLYSGPANGPVFMYGVNVGTAAPTNFAAAVPTALGYAGGMAESRVLGIANGGVIQPLWQQNGGTVNTVVLQVPFFSLIPIRIS